MDCQGSSAKCPRWYICGGVFRQGLAQGQYLLRLKQTLQGISCVLKFIIVSVLNLK